MEEKLCLQWNDFQDNIKSAFGKLRDDKDFTDVTLACEDGQQVEAHKVILAASSPFFQNLLSRNKHPSPLIYMRGIKSLDLFAIMDFLYFGEANVYQENLDSFLAIAEELQLKGLMGKNDEVEVEEKSTTVKPEINRAKTPRRSSYNQGTSENKSVAAGSKEIVAVSSYFSGDLEELEERVKSLIGKSQNLYQGGKYGNELASICKVCGKEGRSNALKDHIEANHLEGIVIPCDHCEKTFRSRDSLRHHKKQHQNTFFKKY